jgi:hypothetical protein
MFHITSVPPDVHASFSGRSTIESRGMETAYARLRSADRCTRMVVSEPPPPSLSMSQPSQSRESEPITRMSSGSPLPV